MNTETNREPTNQEILDILQEECAEVIHAISKCRRFGLDETKSSTESSNRQRLTEEVMDVLAMLDWAVERNILLDDIPDIVEVHFPAKRESVRRYCAYGDSVNA